MFSFVSPSMLKIVLKLLLNIEYNACCKNFVVHKANLILACNIQKSKHFLKCYVLAVVCT